MRERERERESESECVRGREREREREREEGKDRAKCTLLSSCFLEHWYDSSVAVASRQS